MTSIFFFFYYGSARMINRTPLYTKKLLYSFFYGFFEQVNAIFLYKKTEKSGSTSGEKIRSSVAGVAGVPTAPRIEVAPLGAVMLAAARAASRAAVGAATEEAGDEAGRSAVTAALLGGHRRVIKQ
jgi:hypothetical protein